MYKFLKHDCNIPSIMKVAFHESSGSWEYCVIQMKKTNPSQPWQALNAAVSLSAKPFMEHAKEIWEELGFAKLTPKAPWHGYTLGYWSEENEAEAVLAVLPMLC